MISHRNIATAVTTAAALLVSTAAHASDQYSFPSPDGPLIAASTTSLSFVQIPSPGGADAAGSVPSLGGSLTPTGASSMSPVPPPPVASPDYRDRFGARSSNADAYGYRFLTSALATASFANYAADYNRLFAPGYAVSAWTDRVSGFIELGYGGAVDSWTAGAYYLARVRGPARRSETAPDLTLMPKFRPHPELEQTPTFTQPHS